MEVTDKRARPQSCIALACSAILAPCAVAFHSCHPGPTHNKILTNNMMHDFTATTPKLKLPVSDTLKISRLTSSRAGGSMFMSARQR